MKKLMRMMMVAFAAILLAAPAVMASEPLAIQTAGKITIAATATNGSADVWLNCGAESLVKSAVTGNKEKFGAGIVRAVMFDTPDGVMTNWNVNFYAYDGGIKKTLYTTSSTNSAPTSARFDLTTNVYSGRLLVEVFHNYAYTNAATTYRWRAIVE